MDQFEETQVDGFAAELGLQGPKDDEETQVECPKQKEMQVERGQPTVPNVDEKQADIQVLIDAEQLQDISHIGCANPNMQQDPT